MNVVSPPSLDLITYVEAAATYLLKHFPDYMKGFLYVMSYLTVVSIPVSIMLIIGIVLSVERLKRIRAREEAIYDKPKEVPAYDAVTMPDPDLGERWRKILEHLETENQNDWRQAIVEADIILDTILSKQGYQGSTVGDKLKRVEKADFASLDAAWEAHKVRNMIAHEGSNFELSKYEAKRVITLYKEVFSEFFYI